DALVQMQAPGFAEELGLVLARDLDVRLLEGAKQALPHLVEGAEAEAIHDALLDRNRTDIHRHHCTLWPSHGADAVERVRTQFPQVDAGATTEFADAVGQVETGVALRGRL